MLFSQLSGYCPGGTPYDGLYRESPPERSIFVQVQKYKRVGISPIEVYERGGQGIYNYSSFVTVCESGTISQ